MTLTRAFFVLSTCALVVALIALFVAGYFPNAEIVVALIGLGGAIFGALLQYRWAKEKEAESRLFSEKQAVYVELITLIMSLLRPAAFRRQQNERSQDRLTLQLIEIRTKLIVWGSARTLLTLDEMSDLADDNQSDVIDRGLHWQGRLFDAIRSDLGHKDPPGVGLDIAVGILTPEERNRARARLGIEKRGHRK